MRFSVAITILAMMFCQNEARFTLEVEINMGGLRGMVMFNQKNETEALAISVNMDPGEPGPWRILSLPTVYNEDAIASCSNLGPTIADGNLTDRHGMFRYRSTYSDINLKAFGTNSILGRSLVMYYPNDTVRACGTILLFNNSMAYATAVFKGPVGGKVHFLQDEDEPEEPTLVWGEFYHTDGVTSVSDNHDWFISEERIKSFGQCNDSRTVYGVPTLLNHVCSPQEPAACKTGDLGGKLGPISLGVAGNPATRKRFRFVTYGLPLSGSMSILRRGVVLKKATSNEPKACASIMKAGPLGAEAVFVSTSNAGINGMIAFKQESPLHSTKIQAVLSSLANRCGGYHIHSYPSPSDAGEDKCSNGNVGGHFNPYGIDSSSSSYPQPKNDSVDMYEVGDLSGKFGTLQDLTNLDTTYYDPSLSLFGSSSFLGRSIVLHRNDNTSSRLTCANIYPTGAAKLSAKATFDASSDLKGYVLFEQYYQSNSILTATAITVDLSHSSHSNQTMQHNWHIHVEPVGNDHSNPIDSRCASVGPHYNPYNVSVDKPSYTNECTPGSPYRCELGDLNGKHARYNVGGGKKYFIEENVPLYGTETVLGRSLTLHSENAGATRMACADLVPQSGESTDRVDLHVDDTDSFYKKIFQKELSSYLRLSDWQVSYPKVKDMHNSSCYAISFFLIDHRIRPRISQLVLHYNMQIKNTDSIGSLKKCSSATLISTGKLPIAILSSTAILILNYAML